MFEFIMSYYDFFPEVPTPAEGKIFTFLLLGVFLLAAFSYFIPMEIKESNFKENLFMAVCTGVIVIFFLCLIILILPWLVFLILPLGILFWLLSKGISLVKKLLLPKVNKDSLEPPSKLSMMSSAELQDTWDYYLTTEFREGQMYNETLTIGEWVTQLEKEMKVRGMKCPY